MFYVSSIVCLRLLVGPSDYLALNDKGVSIEKVETSNLLLLLDDALFDQVATRDGRGPTGQDVAVPDFGQHQERNRSRIDSRSIIIVRQLLPGGLNLNDTGELFLNCGLTDLSVLLRRPSKGDGNEAGRFSRGCDRNEAAVRVKHVFRLATRWDKKYGRS